MLVNCCCKPSNVDKSVFIPVGVYHYSVSKIRFSMNELGILNTYNSNYPIIDYYLKWDKHVQSKINKTIFSCICYSFLLNYQQFYN